MFLRKPLEKGVEIVGGDYGEFRVAIVDDNLVVQKILTKSLKKFFRVNVSNDDIFDNGLKLLQALEFRRYDLIMMDIEMPVLSGWAATKLIRGEHVGLPISNLMNEIKELTESKTGSDLSPSAFSAGGTLSRRRRAASISRPTSRGNIPPAFSVEEGSMSPAAIGARILGENRLVPIIAVTSVDSPDLRTSYLAAGMNDILIKPVTPSMVQNIFGKYLQAVQLSPTRGLGSASTISSAKMAANMLGGTGQIYSGSREQLLQALIQPKQSGPSYMSEFLLTYRTFMKPEELLSWLQDQFRGHSDEAHTSASNLYVSTENAVAAQHGVAAVLTAWINEQWHDFASNMKLKTSLMDLIGKIREALGTSHANQLKAAVEKQSTKHAIRSAHMRDIMDPATNIIRTVNESLLTPDVSPDKLAQQLCLYDSMLFRHIDSIEFVNLVSKKTSPTLSYFISRFDKESYWVATEIVAKRDLKARINVLRTFIVTAKECLEAQNFFSVFAIMFGLSLSPVQRLKKTWEGLSDNKKKVLAELEKFTDVSKNFKTYRDKLDDSVPPLVPFLPIFIKDLTFMNDGNESRLANNEINFEKLRLITDCVKGITAFAKSEYKWWSFDPDFQEYIQNPVVELGIGKLQEMSLECEPRAGS